MLPGIENLKHVVGMLRGWEHNVFYLINSNLLVERLLLGNLSFSFNLQQCLLCLIQSFDFAPAFIQGRYKNMKISHQRPPAKKLIRLHRCSYVAFGFPKNCENNSNKRTWTEATVHLIKSASGCRALRISRHCRDWKNTSFSLPLLWARSIDTIRRRTSAHMRNSSLLMLLFVDIHCPFSCIFYFEVIFGLAKGRMQLFGGITRIFWKRWIWALQWKLNDLQSTFACL